jgi:DNA-binding NarL/FixJ family response regulator
MAILGEKTVKPHLQTIYKKLNTKGRIGVLKEARKLGLITHD